MSMKVRLKHLKVNHMSCQVCLHFLKKIGCPMFTLMLMMMIVREMLELIELEQLELDLEPNGKKKAGPAR